MAIPNEPTLSTRVSVLKRSEGRSACKFSAYISGTEITQEAARDKAAETFDYRRRVGVEWAELMTPEGAPEWAKDRQSLWNAAEAAEKRKDSQVAREFRVGLSYDLSAEQRQALARRIGAGFTALGMCADVAVHRYSTAYKVSDPRTADQLAKWRKWGIPFVDEAASAGLNSEHVMVRRGRDGAIRDYRIFQPHLHALCTLRPIDASGVGFEGKTERRENGVLVKSRAREWNDQTKYDGLREWITGLQNAALEDIGSPRRVDPRGYEVRREAALDLAEQARASGWTAEAERQEDRAAMLLRQPEPFLGVALRVKELTGRVRERFSQWVAVRHRNQLQPQIEALWKRDHVAFVTKAHHLLELATKGLGLVPLPGLRPALAGVTPPEKDHDYER